VPLIKTFYLHHARWKWWQPLSACFCHANRAHLSGNTFLLLLFGRSVEDDLGWVGLLFAYAFCGVVANLISLALLPARTVSLGASGAVFGLFAISTLGKLSWRNSDWRNLVELGVLGDFVFSKVVSEVTTAAGGGVAGINHVAHLAGAGAGLALVGLMRFAVGKAEKAERKSSGRMQKSPRSSPPRMMGWSDPNWNWGSANGTAHDEAMKVRGALSTPEARNSFLFMVFSGRAPLETVKMALALKCQRARNFGYDDCGWEGLMDEMAACKFEGEEGEEGEAALCEAIRARLKDPPARPAEGSAGSAIQQLNILAAAALKELDFVERGL
jgi:membrane associated rhomboid family serine protease